MLFAEIKLPLVAGQLRPCLDSEPMRFIILPLSPVQIYDCNYLPLIFGSIQIDEYSLTVEFIVFERSFINVPVREMKLPLNIENLHYSSLSSATFPFALSSAQ
jgi:hypothetical protein